MKFFTFLFLFYVSLYATFANAQEAPNARAEYTEGTAYAQGIGRNVDIAKARAHFAISAQGNFVPAFYALGVLALNEKKNEEAFKLFFESAIKGYDRGQYQVGTMYAGGLGVEKNLEEAFQWFNKAAQQGHAIAQYFAAQMLMKGDGTSKDLSQALHWFIKAALQGYSRSQYSAGFMYYTGQGAQKNYAEAFKWFSKAARQWHMQSQVNLGIMYFKGEGVKTNFSKAYKWWDIASSMGHVESHKYRAMCASKMTQDEITKAHQASKDWILEYHAVPHEHAWFSHLHGANIPNSSQQPPATSKNDK